MRVRSWLSVFAVALLAGSAGAQAVAQPAASDAQDSLAPLIQIAPAYPADARARGVEGYVELTATVNAAGSVEKPRVVAAQPSRIFDQAALAALSRWRYPADPQRQVQTVKERIEFRLAGSAATAPAAGPRNQCVRENVVYNYGEMIEVGLMNACAEPLLVFGCAAGTGKYLGRWVCNDSEEQANLLVRPGDERIGGSTVVASSSSGGGSYKYADSFFVARAPNSQYWWVACAANDTGYRAAARDWTRAVDRQSASVDPNRRSHIAVARSY